MRLFFLRPSRPLDRILSWGVLVGLVVTAIIQSSSASVGILQTLALNGMVNWQSAVFITLGQNIGTCVTALLSCIGTSRTAKRAAVIHLLFNVFGTVIFGFAMFFIFIANPAFASSTADSVGISVFHTFSISLIRYSCSRLPDCL